MARILLLFTTIAINQLGMWGSSSTTYPEQGWMVTFGRCFCCCCWVIEDLTLWLFPPFLRNQSELLMLLPLIPVARFHFPPQLFFDSSEIKPWLRISLPLLLLAPLSPNLFLCFYLVSETLSLSLSLSLFSGLSKSIWRPFGMRELLAPSFNIYTTWMRESMIYI